MNSDALKALKSTMAMINKKYGEGTILDTQNMNFEATSTGSAVLDDILGNDGLVHGRIHMVYGDPSSGKCMTADSFILTPQGYVTVKEIFLQSGVPLRKTAYSVVDTETELKRFTLINEYGHPEDTVAFTRNGFKHVNHIVTKHFPTIKVTANHPLRILTEYGTIEWRVSNKLSNNDYLVSNRYFVPQGLHKAKINMDLYSFGFCFVSYLNCYKNIKVHLPTDSNVVNSEQYKRIVKYLGKNISNGYADFSFLNVGVSDTNIPLEIRVATLPEKLSFLLGYLDYLILLNGKFSDELGSQELSLLAQEVGLFSLIHGKCTSEELEQLSVMFPNSFAIQKLVNFYKNKQPTRRIPKQLSSLLVRLIDSVLTRRDIVDPLYSIVSLAVINDDLYNAWKDISSKISGLDYDQSLYLYAQELFETLEYIPIVKIVPSFYQEETYDFMMEYSASFTLNGVRSHNTSIAMSVVASFQKKFPDKAVLYVDAENAFHLEYAQSFGVDISPERLIFVQESCAETVLDIIDKFASTGVISLVVLDSIPALLTLAQLGKDYSEKTMGSLAGVLSPGLSKLKDVLNQTDTTLLIINQVRASMAMYGSPESVPGGNALKFYCSTHFRVKKKDTITDKAGTPIGQELEIRNTKNKVATPFKVGTTKLYFYKGFSVPDEVAEIAINKGIIERSGAWYSWTGHSGINIKVQGSVAVAVRLAEDPDELAHVQSLVEKHGISEVITNFEKDDLPAEDS